MAENLLIMVGVVTALTTLTTESIKNTLKGTRAEISSNVLAAIVSTVLSILSVLLYYVYSDMTLDSQCGIECIVLAYFSWLGSMSSYDKITQLIEQFIYKLHRGAHGNSII